MKKMKIYFNRWFSVTYHYMNAIRDNEDGMEFEIYGTHPDPGHMALQGCDVAEVEPRVTGREYVDFCLDFCRRHQIDVFIPRWNMLDISRHISLFEEIGTRVIVCSDTELLEQLMEKDRFYESVREKGIMEIPDYFTVSNASQFQQAYEALRARGHDVCFKPCNGEGGMGFRVINNERDPLQELFGYALNSISYEDALRAFSSAPSFPNVMVMEVLEGYEYSIDCLSDRNGKLLTAIPRRKERGRLRLLEENEELLAIARNVAEVYRIPYNFNIQMKYRKDTPKLLEINPRMSGGLHMSCLSGVNFPYLAVKSALGHDIGPLHPKFGILGSHIEQPFIIDVQKVSGVHHV
ncbi:MULTISPECIES: ATP-grasp domain-containing protein [unclassified Paenibacillus]|uniref:ATP-grasp domain-containing protein n=1 Tax=unclassified Paenibacillus TaxID=185978 RepID=UPI00122E4B7A|nr:MULTISPECIES: ATP-grasp domain-containing protein [unclassified Paenibacillus]QZN78056.1 ATP-grasp domain-containing protein [Paenibacillus sp. DR312]